MDKMRKWNIWPSNKWLNFRFLSSVILLGMATIYIIINDTDVSADIWFCVWALCIVRFVDVLDEMA